MRTAATVLAAAALLVAQAANAQDAPPAVAVLARVDAQAPAADRELLAGMAVEVGHWLTRAGGVVVRASGDPAGWSPGFPAAAERLNADHVVWLEVKRSGARREVTYAVESEAGAQPPEAIAAEGDGLPSVPRRIAAGARADLLGTMAIDESSWPAPRSGAAYAEFLRALGRRGASNAERLALLERVVPELGAYPPAAAELGAAALDLAGELEGTPSHYDRAERELRAAFELDPGYAPARQKLASYFAKRGRSEESVALLREGLARDPSFPGFHDQLGYVLRYAGHAEASMASYRRAQALDGSVENLVSTQDQITKSLIYLGRYDEALASHERMESYMRRLGGEPDEKEWFYRGVIHLYAGERDAALAAFRRGEELKPVSVWTTFGRGYAGIASGDRHAVTRVLDEMERQGVVDGERHYRLVHFAAFLGDDERALRHLAVSIESGFFAADYLVSDPLTAELRSRPEFERAVRAARERSARLGGLLTEAR